MNDLFLTGYGLAVTALRDDRQGIQALFAGLTPEETAAVAEGALLAMAETVRLALPTETVNHMITAVQELAAHDAAEGEPR
ncbi:hypothetical protein [Streptomyces xanthochromogenes]